MTTKKEWAIGIAGGLVLVTILLAAPPWVIVPALGGIWVIYQIIQKSEKPESA